MIGIAFALLSAVGYGASDFAAGMLSRRAHFVLVGWVGQATGAMLTVTVVLVAGTAVPALSVLAWGALAGAGAAVGALALYHGLAVGQMSVAAPLSAVGAAGLPVLFDLITSGLLPIGGLIGVAAALPGIWLVSSSSTSSGRGGGVVPGLIAGVGFAVLFIGLDRAGDGAGLWPVAASQCAALTVITSLALAWRPGGPRPSWKAMWPGLFGSSATVMYFLATHHGSLSVAAVITSLYPAITIGLAGVILHERTTRVQNVGLVLCGAAVCAFAVS
ncbi:MAG TPA: EamA family transporter [Jatrophihabitantaceae bacterium]|nr:EamA family transporter [Jatrophihabitantaceae bacterium]